MSLSQSALTLPKRIAERLLQVYPSYGHAFIATAVLAATIYFALGVWWFVHRFFTPLTYYEKHCWQTELTGGTFCYYLLPCCWERLTF